MPPAIAVEAVHHLTFATRHFAQSLAFYRDVLGLTQVERPPFSFGGAWLAGPTFQIHINDAPEQAPEPRPLDGRASHYAFRIANAAAVRAAFDAHGIEYLKHVNAAGFDQTFVQDPDGHILEFAVYPGDNPPPLQTGERTRRRR